MKPKIKKISKKSSRASLRILFVTRYPGQFHHLKNIFEAIVKRGHNLKVLFGFKERRNTSEYITTIENFKKEYPNFDYDYSVTRTGLWNYILTTSRDLLTYRRYLLIPQSNYYKDRWREGFPTWIKDFLSTKIGEKVLKSDWTYRGLKFLERKIAPSQAIVASILEYAPDAVLASPVNMRVDGAVADLDYLKAAKFLKIPTALPVMTWDNLTTKGLIHVAPDKLLVWNDAHLAQAKLIHGISADNIRVAGAPLFDSWFSNLKAQTSRAKFCAAHGLNPKYPILTYLGSSTNMVKDETWLVRELKKALAVSKDKKAQKIQIVVRPHPANYEIYKNFKEEGVVLIPKEGELPSDDRALQLFYETLHHSFATIGVNTSAMIDSIIAGLPGIALLTEKYKSTQVDTEHFSQLLGEGVMEVVGKLEELPSVLVNIMNGEDVKKSKRAAFVKKFVRPRGLKMAAGDVVVGEVEELVKKNLGYRV